MQFNSFEFAVFFAAVFVIYWRLGRTAQNRFLLIASYVFYGWWDARFLLLLALTTIVDYWVGLRVAASEQEAHRRRILALSVVVNLTILGFFKYFAFFADSARELAATLGMDLSPVALTIVLPVGVSFYTFQSMSYTIDVFRRRMEPVTALDEFALYVAFFPQLVAGPIERATRLLPQFQTERPSLSVERIQTGIALIVFGLVQKVVIADSAAPVVNRIFGLADASSWKSLVVATLAFGLQIYGDFAGYSNIARGTARLLGIDLMHNFRQPYLSRNITEFWRRWHISLSSWLRDYLYVPLGGNKRGRRRTYVNLIIVMALGGLWHGAALTFVVWGLLHGVFLAVHRVVGKENDKAPYRPLHWHDIAGMLVTFAAVNVAWVFFRADSVGSALTFIRRVVTFQEGFFDILDATMISVLLSAALLLDLIERRFVGRPRELHHPLRLGLAVGVGVSAVLIASGSEIVPFIYFQF